jgi:hypothetical protein
MASNLYNKQLVLEINVAIAVLKLRKQDFLHLKDVFLFACSLVLNLPISYIHA